MWGYLSLLPAFLAFWATAGIWTVKKSFVELPLLSLMSPRLQFFACCGQQGCEPHGRLPLYQEKNQRATHLTGAFFAFFVGIFYFWLQLLLFWRVKSLPQPGAPWIGPLRLVLCSICTILTVAMVVLHTWSLRSASAACEWVVAMLLFTLFGLFAVDFSGLDGCTLCLQPGPGSPSPPPASPIALKVQL
ncbi:modulator of macroautophagy TMEM150B isoform X2 [Eschrichtius robustus]|uniref:modulator of macroautophagy TMEM150B isoform X2 n=1 Tax=Eschrichtius robustus TaxID=9764 RepID=UPI0035C204D8